MNNNTNDILTEDEKTYFKLLPNLKEGKYVLIYNGKLKAIGDSLEEVMEKIEDKNITHVLARKVSKTSYAIEQIEIKNNVNLIDAQVQKDKIYFRNVSAKREKTEKDSIVIGNYLMDTGAQITTMQQQHITQLNLRKIDDILIKGVFSEKKCPVYYCYLCVDRKFVGGRVIEHEEKLIGYNFLLNYNIYLSGQTIVASDKCRCSIL